MAPALLCLALLAGCADEPPERSSESDCFSESPQVAPTRAEVESFTSARLPSGTTGFRASCQGFMDRTLAADFDMPVAELDGFLRRSGFKPRRKSEGEQVVRRDRPEQAYRRLQVQIDGQTATVRLSAFET